MQLRYLPYVLILVAITGCNRAPKALSVEGKQVKPDQTVFAADGVVACFSSDDLQQYVALGPQVEKSQLFPLVRDHKCAVFGGGGDHLKVIRIEPIGSVQAVVASDLDDQTAPQIWVKSDQVSVQD